MSDRMLDIRGPIVNNQGAVSVAATAALRNEGCVHISAGRDPQNHCCVLVAAAWDQGTTEAVIRWFGPICTVGMPEHGLLQEFGRHVAIELRKQRSRDSIHAARQEPRLGVR